MLHPEINWSVCVACNPCQARRACKTHALIQLDPGEAPYIDYSRCTNCGKCALACCCDAITMVNHKIPNVSNQMR